MKNAMLDEPRKEVEFKAQTRRPETVTRTLRLDDDIERAMVDLAKKENLSVNVLANKALRKYTEWDALAERFGFMSLSRNMMTRMMGFLTEEEARELGRWTARNLAMETVLYWFKRADFGSALTVLYRLGQYGNRYKFDYSPAGRKHTLVLKHDMGKKWSIYWEEATGNWLKTILGDTAENVTTSITDNQVSIIIEMRSPIG